MKTPNPKRFTFPAAAAAAATTTPAHQKTTYAPTTPAPENPSPQEEEEKEVENEDQNQDADTGEDNASTQTHYSILRLPPTATPAQIKQSYRSLRTEYFSTDPAKYRALQEAYLVLVDEEARGVYDGSLGLRGSAGTRGTGLLTPPREGGRMRPMSMMGMGAMGMGMGMMGFGEMKVRGMVHELQRPSSSLATANIPSPTATIPSPSLPTTTTTTPTTGYASASAAAKQKPKEKDPNWYLKHSKAASTFIPASPSALVSASASASASPTPTPTTPTPSSIPAIANVKRDLGHHRRRSLIPVLLAARNRAGTMG